MVGLTRWNSFDDVFSFQREGGSPVQPVLERSADSECCQSVAILPSERDGGRLAS